MRTVACSRCFNQETCSAISVPSTLLDILYFNSLVEKFTVNASCFPDHSLKLNHTLVTLSNRARQEKVRYLNQQLYSAIVYLLANSSRYLQLICGEIYTGYSWFPFWLIWWYQSVLEAYLKRVADRTIECFWFLSVWLDVTNHLLKLNHTFNSFFWLQLFLGS